MVTIKVPATSANLSVGFDCLGVALEVYAYISFEYSDTFEITGCEPHFATKDNLVYTSFIKTMKELSLPMKAIHIHMESEIPMSGGLGSSASCVVAGIMGAYALNNIPLDKDIVFQLASKIEGHPDNVAPAIFGGLQACACYSGNVIHKECVVDEKFKFMLLVPNFSTKTKEAREILPTSIPLFDAVQNSANLIMLLKAFETYDTDLLKLAMHDYYHEPYRKALIREYNEVQDICKRIDSLGFYISGSGATLVNFVNDKQSIDKIQDALHKLSGKWKVSLTKVDKKGAQVC